MTEPFGKRTDENWKATKRVEFFEESSKGAQK
jgi:hypothetical protein